MLKSIVGLRISCGAWGFLSDEESCPKAASFLSVGLMEYLIQF